MSIGEKAVVAACVALVLFIFIVVPTMSIISNQKVNQKVARIKADGWRDVAAIVAEGINDFARAPIDIMEWQVQKQKEMIEEAVQDPRPGPRG